MIDIIVLLIIAAAVGFAVAYIVKAKKKGQACIGCPYAKDCNKCSCKKQK